MATNKFIKWAALATVALIWATVALIWAILMVFDPFTHTPAVSQELVIHTSMDVYLINVDSMTVKTGRSDTIYRFNDFIAMSTFVMKRTREEVSENRNYWLELNRKYNTLK